MEGLWHQVVPTAKAFWGVAGRGLGLLESKGIGPRSSGTLRLKTFSVQMTTYIWKIRFSSHLAHYEPFTLL